MRRGRHLHTIATGSPNRGRRKRTLRSKGQGHQEGAPALCRWTLASHHRLTIGLWGDLELPEGQVPERGRSFMGIKADTVIAFKGKYPM